MQKIRFVLAQIQIDSHGVGLKYVSKILMQAGIEVIIYRYRIIDEVAEVAVQEDADAIGLSFYMAGMEYDVPRLMELLKEKNRADLMVVVGGCINKEEKKKLLEWGVKDIFTAGRPIQEVLGCIKENVQLK